MARTYNFSIIRISPDPRRGETVNIGLLVFLRTGVDARILPSLAKVQALHGELDLAELYTLPKKFEHYLPKRGSVSARHEMVRKIGMIELSDLGQFVARGNEEYEAAIGQLMDKLIKPTRARREKDAKNTRLQTEVRKIIRDAHILGRSIDDFAKHKVVSNYPLSLEKGLYTDFAGKNSKYYFTETIDYRVDRGIDGAKFNESTKAAFVLREARRQFSDSHRTILYAASNQVEARIQTHLALMGEFANDFVNFASATDKARFIATLTLAFGGLSFQND